MRRNEISLAVVLLFALFMMTGCVISPRRTLGGSATPTPTPTATPTPTPGATPSPTPVAPTNRLYVSNQNTNSIAVFASGLSTTGNVAPIATIVGGATTFNGPEYLAFDTVNDRLFVANTGSSTVLGSVLIFDHASIATGNVAPRRTIGGPVSGLISPSDVAYDATHDRLYVLDVTDILVYNTVSSATVTGDRPPDRDILVPFNLTAFCLDVVNDRLFATDATNSVAIYDNVSTLNSPTVSVPASRTLLGAATKLASPFGVALDPAGNLVISNSGGGGSITVYSAASVTTGTGQLNIAPVSTISGAATTLSTPAQIILNPLSGAGEMIVADSTAGEVATFTNVTTGGNIAPARKISGTATTITLTGQQTARGVAIDKTTR